MHRQPDLGDCCRGCTDRAGGGHRGDGEVLPDEAVEETRHEESGEDGHGQQGRQGFLRNSQ